MARRPPPRAPAHTRIGCAGWSIASANRHLFGEGASMLARYATRFDAVEINSSFYRPHLRTTYVRWADTVPEDFRFAVKLPRTITHDARLQRSGPMLDAFLAQAGGLGDKLGCLLVQLPPSLAFDARAAATFFAMLRRRWSGPVACEPRHPSWFAPRCQALWARHRIARVAADPARVPEAAVAGGAGAVRYWRWHGAPRMYYSAYDEPALRALAAEVARATPAGAEAWVIFDNTTLGHATTNAASFQALAKR
ncbi:DUF72 domain-containing protein [Luteimonas sp. RD2P54]|uniref:DUF72 domain-containing protein n=1 Tax=Luteimonas endophytica TaxID=3042023 RepID=A0ABT6JB32_9GAMM|nr:DUF72 domain-containing protein [Luteimonas endophytica]MDH5823969.1 DUF72 domain-containing protein [Luteimonas endophytica]